MAPEDEGVEVQQEEEQPQPEGDEETQAQAEEQASDDTGDDEDREPEGSDPQATRARKEYRRRKKAEENAQLLENQLLTLQGQVQALQEVQTKQPQSGRMTLESMTSAQIRAWAEQSGQEYDPAVQQVIREKEETEREERLLAKWEQRQEQRERSKTANEQLLEYQASIPALSRPGSPELIEVAKELNGLTNNGLPNNETTQLMAVKMVFGPLDKMRGKKNSDNYTRRNREVSGETHGGGGGGIENAGGRGGFKNPDGVSVDKETLQHWDEMGYSPEQKKELSKHYTAPRRVTMRM